MKRVKDYNQEDLAHQFNTLANYVRLHPQVSGKINFPAQGKILETYQTQMPPISEFFHVHDRCNGQGDVEKTELFYEHLLDRSEPKRIGSYNFTNKTLKLDNKGFFREKNRKGGVYGLLEKWGAVAERHERSDWQKKLDRLEEEEIKDTLFHQGRIKARGEPLFLFRS